MRACRFALVLVALTVLATGWARAEGRAIIVVDGSASMWNRLNDQARILIARETIRRVLTSVPADTELGLMVYGHRRAGDCDDIELMVDPGPGTADAIVAALDGITPRGKTPISAAVRKAAERLRFDERKATVILVTDGLETCEADPCALATELEARGVDFTAHVVGFGLTEDEGRQVACLADITGGRYFQAEDGDELGQALIETVTDPLNLRGEIFMAEGKPVPADAGLRWTVHRRAPDGTPGEAVLDGTDDAFVEQIEPGPYTIVTRLGEVVRETRIEILPGEVARPRIILDAAILTIRPIGWPEGEPIAEAEVTIVHPAGQSVGRGAVSLIVPAGPQKIGVVIGAVGDGETLDAAPGQTVEREILVPVGRVTLNAEYRPGLKVEEEGLALEVKTVGDEGDGPPPILRVNGPDTAHYLPPGDYVLHAKLGLAEGEAPFAIATGDLVDLAAPLPAGTVMISAPDAVTIELFDAARAEDGSHRSVVRIDGGEFAVTVPVGDYLAVVTQAEGRRREIVVTALPGHTTRKTIAPR